MKVKILFLAATLLASAAISAEIDRVAAALPETEAHFTQRFTPKGFTKGQVESGTVVFGALPKMRWSYLSPEQKVFVFDGNTSWLYIASEKQVTQKSLYEWQRAELPFLLLADPAARDHHFAVHETTRGGTVVTTLRPRAMSGMIRNVTITIDAATHRIQRLAYADREGNQTVFDFSAFAKRSVPADYFHFTAPPGVRLVEYD
jgi:chaperone LolA